MCCISTEVFTPATPSGGQVIHRSRATSSFRRTTIPSERNCSARNQSSRDISARRSALRASSPKQPTSATELTRAKTPNGPCKTKGPPMEVPPGDPCGKQSCESPCNSSNTPLMPGAIRSANAYPSSDNDADMLGRRVVVAIDTSYVDDDMKSPEQPKTDSAAPKGALRT